MSFKVVACKLQYKKENNKDFGKSEQFVKIT